ncbi:hypothetical protein [Streptomyces sp. FH025]|uniref:hypothetical protein n=1 Tax=Streptomyces sp. FH025 TaxID=2815937 RepID=UPI001A9D0E15|nr:hypothetical protein [Streptomyces sp. FH025]MBO1414445.1 hypothetical protein [Streptomyces sp. FH025]
MATRATGIAAAAVLAAVVVTGCGPSDTATKVDTRTSASTATAAVPLGEAELSGRLLTMTDLGTGYAPSSRDDLTVPGCPVYDQPGGGGLQFATKVTAKFSGTTANGSGTLTEELHTDSPTKLSEGTKAVFDAFAKCGSFDMSLGSTQTQVTVNPAEAPKLGDESYAQLVTLSGGRTLVYKQQAVRAGNVLVVLTGTPALVDAQLPHAVEKACGSH